MVLYIDILTGDKMFSDAFPIKLVNDLVYEVDCAIISLGSGEDLVDEGFQGASTTVNNVIHSFQLCPKTFDKKSYLAYIKGYIKAVKTKLSEERIPIFEAQATELIKEILANFEDLEFYTGKSQSLEGMVAFLNY